MEKTIKVAVVEDSPDEREALFFLVRGSPGFTCVAACRNAEECLEKLPPLKPDVVLMDIGLPGISGIECIGRLKRLLPDTQMMMLTVFEDHDRIFQALSAGAAGYLVKKTAPAKLLEAIQELRAGGAPMSGQIARQVVAAFQKPPPQCAALAELSPREREILADLAQGFLYKEIADKIGISINTVRTHIGKIYEKLQVRSRTEAILKTLPVGTR